MPGTQRQTTTQASPDAPGVLKSEGDSDNPGNTLPQGNVTVADSSGPGEYRVLVGAMTVAADRDGKKVRRYVRGEKIVLGDHHEIERLLALRAVEPWPATRKDSIGFSSALAVAQAANAAAQENDPTFLPDGEPVAPSGEADTDDDA